MEGYWRKLLPEILKFFPLTKVSVAKVSYSNVHYLFLLAKEEVKEDSSCVKCETSEFDWAPKVCISFIVEKENCFRKQENQWYWCPSLKKQKQESEDQ